MSFAIEVGYTRSEANIQEIQICLDDKIFMYIIFAHILKKLEFNFFISK